MKPDYKKIGLKVGLEIHQELDTRKLFCNCPSTLRDENPEILMSRNLRPTQSELGAIDRAALAEVLKGKSFKYEIYPDTVCLVEMDEEPPHPVTEEALDATLEAALLMNAKIVDEIHTMRKIVIDGSNTCGFQRTILVATDGFVELEGKRYSIGTICLEEDAARKIAESEDFVGYRLDRLGIPLVEIATGPEFSDTKTPARAALYIGQLLRATGKMKRGIGTIRQDINISIAEGARQEIKGIQELGLIKEVIEREVQRQLNLLKIRDELKRKGAGEIQQKFIDVSGVLEKTECKVIRKTLGEGGKVLAVRLSKFAGLVGFEIQPGRRLGTELADRARIYGKVAGLFHTDELPRFGISQQEVDKLRAAANASDDDAVIIVADQERKARAALEAVAARAGQAIEGVFEETRRALPDGNTEYMRPLPGAERMYPETDIPSIPITEARLRKLKSGLPEIPEKKIDRFIKTYGLSKELAERIVYSENLSLFEGLVEKTAADPTLVVTTLEETMVSLRRADVKVEKIKASDLEQVFSRVTQGKSSKEAVPEILKALAEDLTVDEAMEKLGLAMIERSELEKIVKKTVGENEKMVESRGMAAMGPLMGAVMEQVRGKADGKLVHEILEKELKKLRIKTSGN